MPAPTRHLLRLLLVAVMGVAPFGVAQGGEAAAATVGWDGLKVRAVDDAFGAEIHLLLQARGQLQQTPGPEIADAPSTDMLTGGVQIWKARPMLVFTALKGRLRAMFQAEFAGTARVLDARLDVKATRHLSFGGGLVVVPFSRAWLVPLPVMQVPERSLANDRFTPSRRVGAYLTAAPASGVVRVWAGAFDPVTTDPFAAPAHAPLGMVRLQVNPLGETAPHEAPSVAGPAPAKVQVGVGALAQPVVEATEPDPVQLTTTLDAGVQVAGFSLHGEAFAEWRSDAAWAVGGGAQVGQFVVPRHLSFAARVTAIDEDPTDPVGVQVWPEAVLGGYVHGTHVALMARYRAGVQDGALVEHVGTLQTQLQL